MFLKIRTKDELLLLNTEHIAHVRFKEWNATYSIEIKLLDKRLVINCEDMRILKTLFKFISDKLEVNSFDIVLDTMEFYD